MFSVVPKQVCFKFCAKVQKLFDVCNGLCLFFLLVKVKFKQNGTSHILRIWFVFSPHFAHKNLRATMCFAIKNFGVSMILCSKDLRDTKKISNFEGTDTV